jgi:hypothetical protein
MGNEKFILTLAINPEGKRLFGVPWGRWKDNIKIGLK